VLLNPGDDDDELDDSPDDDKCLKMTIHAKAKEFLTNGDVVNVTSSVCTEFLSELECSTADVDIIKTATRGQSANPLWLEMRKGLLTASNFHRFSNLGKTVTSKPESVDDKRAKSFTDLVMGNASTMDSDHLPAPIRWGQTKEKSARDLYRRTNRHMHKGLLVEEKGLCVSHIHPFIGCSVDGVVTCKCHPKRLVEIKCPYSLKSIHPKDASINKGCTQAADGSWIVVPTSPYYCQIQGQMGIYQCESLDLVIFTQKGIHVSKCKFSESFFTEMLKNLKVCYERYIVPHILLTGMNEQ
jgi:hypothetical protein